MYIKVTFSFSFSSLLKVPNTKTSANGIEVKLENEIFPVVSVCP